MIPAEVISRWKRDADVRERTTLENLLELRGYIREAHAEGERVVAQMYAEAAPAFRVTKKTLQNKLSVLRNYDDEALRRWIKSGIALDTVSRIGIMADMGMTGNETPAAIIDRVVEQGNGEGKAATADEIEVLLLEQNGFKPAEYLANRAAWKFVKFIGVRDTDNFLKDLWLLVDKYR